MQFLDSHGSRRITHRSYGKLGESNCQKPTLKRLSSILLKMDKGGKRSKKKKTNFERNYCNKVHRKETEQNMNRPCLKERRNNNRTTKPDPEPLLLRRNKDQGNFQRRITLRKTELLNLTKSKPEPNQNRFLLIGDNDDRTKRNFLSRVTLQQEEQSRSQNKVMNRIGGVENGRNLSKRLNLHRPLQRPKCLKK